MGRMELLTLRVLGGCDVGPTDGFEYHAGEDRSIQLQIIGVDTGYPYALPSDVTNPTLYAPTIGDDLEFDISAVIDDDDRSIFELVLDSEDTTNMISGYLRLEWDQDSGAVHRIANAEFIQTKVGG